MLNPAMDAPHGGPDIRWAELARVDETLFQVHRKAPSID